MVKLSATWMRPWSRCLSWYFCECKLCAMDTEIGMLVCLKLLCRIHWREEKVKWTDGDLKHESKKKVECLNDALMDRYITNCSWSYWFAREFVYSNLMLCCYTDTVNVSWHFTACQQAETISKHSILCVRIIIYYKDNFTQTGTLALPFQSRDPFYSSFWLCQKTCKMNHFFLAILICAARGVQYYIKKRSQVWAGQVKTWQYSKLQITWLIIMNCVKQAMMWLLFTKLIYFDFEWLINT